MRAVVTGGAGFLGSHLVDRLIVEGWSVVVIDNLITGSLENLGHLFGNKRFAFVEQDVTEYLYVAGDVDWVIHFASPASPIDFERYPIPVLKVGALGTHKALGLAKAKRARFMLASTSEVYGDPLVSPQPETYWGNVNPIGKRGVYDEAKRYAEAMTMAYHTFHGLDTRIARLFNTYGPRMRLDDGRVVPSLVGQALRGEPITVHGDGLQTRSFAYVDDIVEGVWRLAHAEFNEPINLGSDEEMTILEFAEAVQSAAGSAVPIVHEGAAPDDPRRRRPDLARARAVLQWSAPTTLADGLARTIDDVRRRLVEG